MSSGHMAIRLDGEPAAVAEVFTSLEREGIVPNFASLDRTQYRSGDAMNRPGSGDCSFS